MITEKVISAVSTVAFNGTWNGSKRNVPRIESVVSLLTICWKESFQMIQGIISIFKQIVECFYRPLNFDLIYIWISENVHNGRLEFKN